MYQYFLQQDLGLDIIGDLMTLLIEIFIVEFVGMFFEVLLFDVIGGIFDSIFITQNYGFDNPLAFGLFLVFLATAIGVLWYNVDMREL
jgi:hypothetical protein